METEDRLTGRMTLRSWTPHCWEVLASEEKGQDGTQTSPPIPLSQPGLLAVICILKVVFLVLSCLL